MVDAFSYPSLLVERLGVFALSAAILVAGLFVPTVALATMPLLTDRPKQISPSSCKAWAEGQNEEAIYMWGVQESGEYNSTIGVKRLADLCLGKPKPDIVGFGSGAGFDAAYCQKHPKTAICRQRAAR
jgi:hypothetical protein